MSRRRGFILAGVLAVGALALVARRPRPAPEAVPPAWVGSAACVGCHEDQASRWRTSQHAHAMGSPTMEGVLGDFSDVSFTHDGVTSEFFRRDGGYFVRTDGSDGGLQDFAVVHTFGVFPLQQYLVGLPSPRPSPPRGEGALQALRLAWNARDGGWFALFPDEHLAPGDELHWTGRQQNWNFMCADCHATNVRKGFDADAGVYATTFVEPGVGCEACHGPGSEHVRRAKAGEKGGLPVSLDERRGVRWPIAPETGNAQRVPARTTETELRVCAPCHSHREQFADGRVPGEPIGDHYRLSRLNPPLFHPDGQQRDEVFTFQTFSTSRMAAAGVTCGDCHEPHGGALRAEGNALCAQCHAQAKYDAPTHHFHPVESAGARCVACHLPTTTYMELDPRHDHGFHVPRPDRAVALGVPEPCTGCHRDRDARWAADALRARVPAPKRGAHGFAEAFAASDALQPSAEALLEVARNAKTPLVRASAIDRLAPFPALAPQVSPFLADPSPLVREATVAFFEGVAPAERGAVAPALEDPVRAVRLAAARVLAPVDPTTLGALEKAARAARAEYLEAERFNADRPEHRRNLGDFFAAQGQLDAAEAEYRAALLMDRRLLPAWVNLADLFRRRAQERECEAILREGLLVLPEAGLLRQALGFSLLRQQRVEEAEAVLRTVQGAPP